MCILRSHKVLTLGNLRRNKLKFTWKFTNTKKIFVEVKKSCCSYLKSRSAWEAQNLCFRTQFKHPVCDAIKPEPLPQSCSYKAWERHHESLIGMCGCKKTRCSVRFQHNVPLTKKKTNKKTPNFNWGDQVITQQKISICIFSLFHYTKIHSH